GKLSVRKYVDKKFLGNDSKGFYTGFSLMNKYGFTSQNSNTIEVISNCATTKQRNILIGGRRIILYKPIIKITDENINELEFLEIMKFLDTLSELNVNDTRIMLKRYISDKKIKFDLVKELLPYFPDKVYKNIFNGGLMNELV
ncbi:MAG: hypothetical protein HUJ61_07170, partial [Bacilli bacterium]|nr:hypothetical protein [Bacilli bacterium]